MDDEFELNHEDIVEASNMPSAMCVHCIDRPSEYTVVFTDWATDEEYTRTLCRVCAEAILSDI